MSENEYRAWVETGQRVEARYASGDGVRATGRVVSWSTEPTLLIITDDGERVNWNQSLVHPVEPVDDPKVGEVRAEGDHSVWQVEENGDGHRFWRCTHSTSPGNRGATLPLSGADGWPAIGAVPGTPAWDLWIKGELKGAPPFPVLEDDDPLTPEYRAHMNHAHEPYARAGCSFCPRGSGSSDGAVQPLPEWERELLEQGTRPLRVFRSDGPEPPADVECLEWLRFDEAVNSCQYVKRLARYPKAGWHWAETPGEVLVAGEVFQWPPNQGIDIGTFREVLPS